MVLKLEGCPDPTALLQIEVSWEIKDEGTRSAPARATATKNYKSEVYTDKQQKESSEFEKKNVITQVIEEEKTLKYENEKLKGEILRVKFDG